MSSFASPAGATGTTRAATRRTINLFAVTLPGSSRSASADVVRADAIYRQCGVAVRLAGVQNAATDVLDRLDPKGVLNEYASPTSPTVEETAMLALRPGPAGALRVYYVPAMSAGSRGEAFLPSITPALPPAVVVSNGAARDTLAHELGHVLLNEAGHHSDPNNLMASGAIRNVGVDNLDPSQCGKL